jgi:hypothetical protein
MPNLVGIGLSQVPTNSMLGGMAYQDPDRVKIKKLHVDKISQINSEIADSATDIFIYDTSKDSDGGAWRKRTSHTSWYNETLGTATRGTRREFPAVAVIVSTTTEVTIYDGDDPNLPMWMVFDATTSNGINNVPLLQYSGQNGYPTAALNGTLVIGQDTNGDNWGSPIINFISEYIVRMDPHSSEGGIFNGGVAQRHDNVGFNSPGKLIIVNSQINDVVMKVLPNAPIDDATGLPVPTIAVGTRDGVSIIKDDGSVIDYVHQNGTYDQTSFIEFLGDDRVAYAWDNGPTPRRVYITPVRPTDTATVDPLSHPRNTVETVGYGRRTDTKVVGNYHGHLLGTDQSVAAAMNGSVIAIGDGSDGLNLIDAQGAGDDTFNSRIAFISKNYNTGWQYGNIKGTFLSSNSTNTDGPEFIVGGDFSNAANWSLGTGWSINGSGQAVHSGGAGYLEQATSGGNNFVQGRWYQLLVDVVSGNGSSFGIVNHHDTSIAQPHTGNAYSDVYVVQSGNKGMALWKQSGNNLNNINLYANGTVTIDAVSIKEITEEYYDRSVNQYHLLRYGTITRSAVATGAELIAYSGWSDSNFLRQPYNADLNYGTGDFSVMGWFKMPDVSQLGFIFDRASLTTSGGGPRIAVYTESSQLKFYTFNGSSNTEESTSISGYNNTWVCFVCNRLSNGNQEMYLNGELKDSMSGTSRDVSNTASPVTTIGHRFNAAAGATTANIFDGSLALLRTSASVLSAEQVKKIYEDEKSLFLENANATLYGSSDAVTALAYDEVTDRLHVGTSSGRSDFQGLRRINNTTTAVTTAISAHDGFIVEQ